MYIIKKHDLKAYLLEDNEQTVPTMYSVAFAIIFNAIFLAVFQERDTFFTHPIFIVIYFIFITLTLRYFFTGKIFVKSYKNQFYKWSHNKKIKYFLDFNTLVFYTDSIHEYMDLEEYLSRNPSTDDIAYGAALIYKSEKSNL